MGDGVYFPGDPISVSFDEDIDCALPWSFPFTLLVGGVDRPASTLVTRCVGNEIAFRIDDTLSLAQLVGRSVAIAVENVQDLAGNPTESVVAWQFDVFPVTLNTASLTLSGLIHQTPFASITDAPAWSAQFLAELHAALHLLIFAPTAPVPASVDQVS